MNSQGLKALYGRLIGIRELVNSHATVKVFVLEDYNKVVHDISKILAEDLSSFCAKQSCYVGLPSLAPSSDIRDKLVQLLPYLEYGYSLNEGIVKIGSIYNSIADNELRERCSDILSSSSNFDRVINQATLVLENRIRKKSKQKGLVGVSLVNKVINADLSKTILKISDNKEEHEGISHICRGIMLAFRNPTHHYLIDHYSREDALKFCAFIDNILQSIDKAEIICGEDGTRKEPHSASD